jgi:hypothetical protein
MDVETFNILIRNKLKVFDAGEMENALLAKYKTLIKDDSYYDFVFESGNGGFFYKQSIQIYGFSSNKDFHNIDYINLLLEKEYGRIIEGLISFSQDLFGNQFCFNTANNEVIFLELETGEREVIASSFLDWINEIDARTDYFAGTNVLKEWLLNNEFDYDQRLCPKIPFVMGGSFKVENLYGGIFPNFIRAYANIARQVYGLPEGTKVKLVIDKKMEK